jgi:hypothetical protein
MNVRRKPKKVVRKITKLYKNTVDSFAFNEHFTAKDFVKKFEELYYKLHSDNKEYMVYNWLVNHSEFVEKAKLENSRSFTFWRNYQTLEEILPLPAVIDLTFEDKLFAKLDRIIELLDEICH